MCPKSHADVSENGPPFPAGGRPENDTRYPKKLGKNMAVLGLITLKRVDWFCGPKTNVFS